MTFVELIKLNREERIDIKVGKKIWEKMCVILDGSNSGFRMLTGSFEYKKSIIMLE